MSTSRNTIRCLVSALAVAAPLLLTVKVWVNASSRLRLPKSVSSSELGLVSPLVMTWVVPCRSVKNTCPAAPTGDA